MSKRAARQPCQDPEERARDKRINALNLEPTTMMREGRRPDMERTHSWLTVRPKRDDQKYTVQNKDDKEDVPYTPTIRLKERQGDQDHAVHEPPRVQDPHAPKSWVDRRCKDDQSEPARDRGHSSGSTDNPPQQHVILRAAKAIVEKEDREKIKLQEKINAIMEKEAQEKIDRQNAIGKAKKDAATDNLASDEEAEDNRYYKLRKGKFHKRMKEDDVWEKDHWEWDPEAYYEAKNQRRAIQKQEDEDDKDTWLRRKADLGVFYKELIRRLEREEEDREREALEKKKPGYCPAGMTQQTWANIKERERDRAMCELREGRAPRQREDPPSDNEDDDKKRKYPWRPVLQESSQQWWGGQTWRWTSSGWSYNGGWHDQGEHEQETYTERGKSIVNKNKNESDEWEDYDPVAWDNARSNARNNAWENPARGNGQTPGASSSSTAVADPYALQWGHDRGRMRRIG